MPHRSIRLRTTATATAVVGLALAASGAALVALLHGTLSADAEAAATLRAQEVVSLLAAGTAPTELAGGESDETFVQVLGDAGQVLLASPALRGRPAVAVPPPGRPTRVEGLGIGDDAANYVLVAAPAPQDRLVVAGRSLESVDESTRLLAGALLAGVPVLTGLVAALTWRLTGQALRPVEAIRREVAELSHARLHRRVPEPAGDDEIARLARTMNAMLDRLEEARDRQRRFVSDAGHELRSPLAALRNHLEVAGSYPAQVDVADLVAGLLPEERRLEGLVEDLLVLARADEGMLGTSRRPVDLDDAVLAEAAALRRRAGLTVDLSGVGPGRVDGDAGQLARVVRNLLDNAARHARSTVRVALEQQGDTVVLAVSDDGAGVPDADRTRVFERFTRLDEARARDAGGVGLGLAVVAEVVRAHGGAARVEGSRFTVTLPASRD